MYMIRFDVLLLVQAMVVNNSIGRDGLVGADATQRRSQAVAFLIQVLCTAGSYSVGRGV